MSFPVMPDKDQSHPAAPTVANRDDNDDAADVGAVDEVPFSLFVKLYADLRNARLPLSARARLGSHNQPDTRYGLLTTFWLRVCDRVLAARDTLSARPSDSEIIPAHLLPPPAVLKLVCLLVPPLDPVHVYLGMKETKLADAFIRALDLPPQSDDAQWLQHYKERAYRPRKWRNDADIVDGNLPSVLRAVLHGRCPTVSSLTVGKVWHVLDMLSQTARVRNRRIINVSHAIPADNPDIDAEDANFDSWRKRSAAVMDETKYNAFASLVQVATADEVAEVAHIILKDLNMRLSQDNFLNWFHPGAKQHYTQIHDIRRMLKDCHDPLFNIGDATVHLGQYASVMLTMRPSRKNLPTICEKLLGGGSEPGDSGTKNGTCAERPYFIMEPKLDGERMQLHKWKRQQDNGDGDVEIRTFSRRGNDSSAMYADALYDVILRGVRARDVILDGEIMIWDDLRATWLRFEDMREVTTAIARRSVPEGSAYTLKYMVFDVLYVDQGTRHQDDVRRDGNMVMRFPLRQRRELLENIVKQTEVSYVAGARAVIEVVGMERGHDERELTNALQRFETLGYEGVIAKHPDRPYVLAERNLDISIKLKPDYFDGGITDVDVIILGAKYSSSHGNRAQRAGKLSSFLVGVRASDSDDGMQGHGKIRGEEGGRREKWVVVGSVGTGYSDKDLGEIQSQLEHEWHDFDAKNLPEHFEERKYASTVLADVAKWVQPWKSVVLTVRAFELNRKYNILRFPRVERINWEKPYYDVTTFSHLLDLDENKAQATVRGDEEDADDVGVAPETKRRRKGLDEAEEEAMLLAQEEGHQIRGGRNARSVIGSAVGADVSKVERVGNVFADLTFHVMETEAATKEKVEVKIHELGGKFVQNLTESVDYVIGMSRQDERTRQLQERLENGAVDLGGLSIVNASWVDKCRKKVSMTVPAKTQVIFASAALERELYKDCDRYGDWWEKEADLDTFEYGIKEVLKCRKGDGRSSASDGQKSRTKVPDDVEQRVRACMKGSGLIFMGMVVAVAENNGGMEMVGSLGLLRAFGARVVNTGDGAVTHMLVHSSMEEKWKASRESVPTDDKAGDLVVISEKWVRKSIDEGPLQER